MTIDELKKKIGNAKYEEIMALVRKAKAEGKSTDEIVAQIRAKFGNELAPPDVEALFPPPPPPPPRKP